MNFKFLFFILLSIYLSGQEKFQVNYTYKITEDVDYMVNKMVSETNGAVNAKDYRLALLDRLNKESEFILISDNKESIFSSVAKLDNSQVNSLSVSYGDESYLLYKNLNEKIYKTSNQDLGKEYLIQDKLKIFDWKILDESKTILGYKAFKAISEDENLIYEAYFSEEFKINNGPDIYQGLPGLILEIRIVSKNNHLSTVFYQANNVKTDTKVKIKEPKKGILVSDLEFNNLSEKYYNKAREVHSQRIDID